MKDFSNYIGGLGLDLGSKLLNQVYLALFGGNVEASTLGNETDNQIRFDWWGNSLLGLKMNSQTERVINNVALNSKGRVQIENAVKNDLQFLNNLVTYSVKVSIPKTDTVDIFVSLTEKKNDKKSNIKIQFDIVKKEIIHEINT